MLFDKHFMKKGLLKEVEHMVNGSDTWHMAPDEQWFPWCEQHRGWLARGFLERLDRHASTNDFFGSWFDIHGKKADRIFHGARLHRQSGKNICSKRNRTFYFLPRKKVGDGISESGQQGRGGVTDDAFW